MIKPLLEPLFIYVFRDYIKAQLHTKESPIIIKAKFTFHNSKIKSGISKKKS